MEFLVRLEIEFPPGVDADEVVAAERARAAVLQRDLKLLRIWRDPGLKGNWTLWRFDSANEFHAEFSRLPAFPYFRNVRVYPLARHPIDSGPGQA